MEKKSTETAQPTGRIVAIVGGPAAGKSTLARHLASTGYLTRLEGEEKDFPDFIRENCAAQERWLETEIFFVNQCVKRQHEAQRLKAEGELIVLDTCLLTHYAYALAADDRPTESGLVRQLILNLAGLLPPVDVLVFLSADDQLIQERLAARNWAMNEKFLPYGLRVNATHHQLMNSLMRWRHFGRQQLICDARLTPEEMTVAVDFICGRPAPTTP